MNVCSIIPCEVTLMDGANVRSDSDAYRAECEARAVLRIPGRMERLAWLRSVEMKRGEASKERLRKDVLRIFELQQKKLSALRA